MRWAADSWRATAASGAGLGDGIPGGKVRHDSCTSDDDCKPFEDGRRRLSPGESGVAFGLDGCHALLSGLHICGVRHGMLVSVMVMSVVFGIRSVFVNLTRQGVIKAEG